MRFKSILSKWEEGRYSQLSVDKGAAVSSGCDALDELAHPVEQILRTRGRRISPVPVLALGAIRRLDVHAAKLGAHDGRSGNVLASGVDLAGDLAHEEVTAGLLAEDLVEILARLLQDRSVGVVVEGGKVGDDVFPAAVVVDAACRIEDSANFRSIMPSLKTKSR